MFKSPPSPSSPIKHTPNQQGYAQFIAGSSIAVFTVHVVSARICNIHDRVTHWDAASAAAAAGSASGEQGGK
jgi:hypothetical protein